MKRTIVITLALMGCIFAYGQKAEYIETFVANDYEPEWYKEQAEAWQKIVDENPKDQWAWRNLFRATNYYEQFTGGWGENQDESKTADVIRKMEAELPDSYVLNLCKCRFCLTTDEAAKRGENIPRAIEQMPEDICPEDFDFLTVRLWITDPENPNIKDMCSRTYQNKYYPTRIMHFNYNMLQCLQPNALYFSNGDLDTMPMKVLQEALGIRTDVNIINISFLYTESFKNMLYKKLNIKPLDINWQDYAQYGEDWLKHYEADIIMHLIKESKLPAYFSPTTPIATILNKDSIYNEGLILKYSPKQYDNFAVAMHNVKEVYNLEYLAEPDLVYDSWKTSGQIDLNHVTLLSNLIPKFKKKGDNAAAEHLYNILSKCIERCATSPEQKVEYENMLKEQAEKK